MLVDGPCVPSQRQRIHRLIDWSLYDELHPALSLSRDLAELLSIASRRGLEPRAVSFEGERTTSTNQAPSLNLVALHAMREMARAQAAGRCLNAMDLAAELGVRRSDIRAVVGELDRQGLVDALRMKLTLVGFGYVAGMANSKFGDQPLRKPRREGLALLRAA